MSLTKGERVLACVLARTGRPLLKNYQMRKTYHGRSCRLVLSMMGSWTYATIPGGMEVSDKAHATFHRSEENFLTLD